MSKASVTWSVVSMVSARDGVVNARFDELDRPIRAVQFFAVVDFFRILESGDAKESQSVCAMVVHNGRVVPADIVPGFKGLQCP